MTATEPLPEQEQARHGPVLREPAPRERAGFPPPCAAARPGEQADCTGQIAARVQ
jgi:hypothetical protein